MSGTLVLIIVGVAALVAWGDLIRAAARDRRRTL